LIEGGQNLLGLLLLLARLPALGPFLCADQPWNLQPIPNLSCYNEEAGMSHWRKRNPPASQFNASLAGWSIAFSVFIGALVVLSLHGHVGHL
jgi:hypothetical protein